MRGLNSRAVGGGDGRVVIGTAAAAEEKAERGTVEREVERAGGS